MPRTPRPTARALVLILAVGLAGCPRPSAPAEAGLKLSDCRPEGLSERARCGRLEVPEDRARPDGRRLSLNVVVLPAKSARPAPDPLYVLAGGPGQAATRVGALLAPAFSRVRKKRAVVLVDQRGTGDSNPLVCRQEPKSLAARFDPSFDGDSIRRCLEGLDADPRHYGTAAAADDLDAVRAALGHERINLWGASYGTRAALVYLRRHGERVRAVVLDGAVPLELRLPIEFPQDGQSALDALFADCAADPACNGAFPALRATFDGLMARLAEKPLRDTVAHPRSGAAVEVEVGRDAFAASLRALLYDVDVASLLPLTIARAAAGELDPFVAQAFAFSDSLESDLAYGLMLSVTCAEDLPRIESAEASEKARGSFVGPMVYESMRQACAIWPRGEVPEGFFEPVGSPAPVLILSGRLDPATPPRWGEAAARTLPHARHVVAPGVGHGVTVRGCAPRLIARFFEQGSAEGLDVSCLEELKRPPFFTSFAGPTP